MNMAALRQCLRRFPLGKNATESSRGTWTISTVTSKNNYATAPVKQEDDSTPPAHRTLDSFAKSLSSRGYLRSIKPYTPPKSLEQDFKTVCEKVLGITNMSDDIALDNGRLKYKLLAECFQEFKHGVPNSVLYKIKTLGDVLNFYKISVDSRVPLDKLKTVPLPPNLHIQYEYHRFHPDTDTKFGGVSAFPKSSTLVTGLKYKKKYQGHKAKTSWP